MVLFKNPGSEKKLFHNSEKGLKRRPRVFGNKIKAYILAKKFA